MIVPIVGTTEPYEGELCVHGFDIIPLDDDAALAAARR